MTDPRPPTAEEIADELVRAREGKRKKPKKPPPPDPAALARRNVPREGKR